MALARRTRLLILGLSITLAFSLVLFGNEPPVQYSVDEVMESPSEHEGMVNLRGTVTVGSFDSSSRSFTINGSSHSLLIDAGSIPIPPAFEEGRVVVIKGILSLDDGVWKVSAEEVITGCPSKYEAEA
mgnify:CR=1 FL=1